MMGHVRTDISERDIKSPVILLVQHAHHQCNSAFEILGIACTMKSLEIRCSELDLGFVSLNWAVAEDTLARKNQRVQQSSNSSNSRLDKSEFILSVDSFVIGNIKAVKNRHRGMGIGHRYR